MYGNNYQVFLNVKNDHYLQLNLDKIANRKNLFKYNELKSIHKPKITRYSELEKSYEIQKSNSHFKTRIDKILNDNKLKLTVNPFSEVKISKNPLSKKIGLENIRNSNEELFKRINEKVSFINFKNSDDLFNKQSQMIRSKMMKIKPLKISLEIEKSVRSLFKNKKDKNNDLRYSKSHFKTMSDHSNSTTKNITFMSCSNKKDIANNFNKSINEKEVKFELIKSHYKSSSQCDNQTLNSEYYSLPLITITNSNSNANELSTINNITSFNGETKEKIRKFNKIQEKILKKIEENKQSKEHKFNRKDVLNTIS